MIDLVPGPGKPWVHLTSSQAVEEQMLQVLKYLGTSLCSSSFIARKNRLLDRNQNIQLFHVAKSMIVVICDAQSGFQENTQLSEL